LFASRTESESESSETKIVAVIEDPFVRKLLHDLLVRSGYQVLESSAARARATLREGTGHIHVVITNTPQEFLEFAATVPVLYLAAAPDEDLANRFAHCRMVRKPFHADHFLATLSELAGA
jgi:hypothetical protein